MTLENVVAALIVSNAMVCLIGAFYAACAIETMSRRTKLSIWLAFIAQGVGWFCQFLAAIDYFHGDALGWPWFLLAGVLLANAGTACVFLANRRDCSCPGCPARQALCDGAESAVRFVDRPNGEGK